MDLRSVWSPCSQVLPRSLRTSGVDFWHQPMLKTMAGLVSIFTERKMGFGYPDITVICVRLQYSFSEET